MTGQTAIDQDLDKAADRSEDVNSAHLLTGTLGKEGSGMISNSHMLLKWTVQWNWW